MYTVQCTLYCKVQSTLQCKLHFSVKCQYIKEETGRVYFLKEYAIYFYLFLHQGLTVQSTLKFTAHIKENFTVESTVLDPFNLLKGFLNKPDFQVVLRAP